MTMVFSALSPIDDAGTAAGGAAARGAPAVGAAVAAAPGEAAGAAGVAGCEPRYTRVHATITASESAEAITTRVISDISFMRAPHRMNPCAAGAAPLRLRGPPRAPDRVRPG